MPDMVCPINNLAVCPKEACGIWDHERNKCSLATCADALAKEAASTVMMRTALDDFSDGMDDFTEVLAAIAEKLGVEMPEPDEDRGGRSRN